MSLSKDVLQIRETTDTGSRRDRTRTVETFYSDGSRSVVVTTTDAATGNSTVEATNYLAPDRGVAAEEAAADQFIEQGVEVSPETTTPTLLTAVKRRFLTTRRADDEDQRQSAMGISAGSDESESEERQRGTESGEENETFRLEEDVFSLLFVSRFRSSSFAYSLIFFGIQVSILVLIAVNLLADAPEGNPLKVPLRTEPEVMAAQGLALLVSVVTQDDVIATLDQVRVGYDPAVLRTFGGATRFKWILSNGCRLAEGLLSIWVSFVFIVQSTTVLDLFLNFAAVTFVSSLDDAAFKLAKKGYTLGSIERTAKALVGVTFAHRTKRVLPLTGGRALPTRWLQRGVFFCATLALFAGWIVIRVRQANGHYLDQSCQVFDLRLGDQYYDFFKSHECDRSVDGGCPWKDRVRPLHYGPFSDSYEASKVGGGRGKFELEAIRPVYYQRGRRGGFGDGSPPGKFSYCEEEEAWVFTVEGVSKARPDGCDWLIRSPKTKAYVLDEAPADGWSIWTGVLEPPTPFELTCGECEDDVDCNYHGICTKEKRCDCERPWMGRQCQTCAGCSRLNETLTGIFSWGGEEVYEPETHFVRLNDTEVYSRPVYYRNDTLLGTYDSEHGTVEIMFYAGTRFYIVGWQGFVADPDAGLADDDLDNLRDFFDDFHSTWHLDDNPNRTMLFYTDVTTNPMPIAVTWNKFKDSPPLAIVTGDPSGAPERADIRFDCASAVEADACSFQESALE